MPRQTVSIMLMMCFFFIIWRELFDLDIITHSNLKKYECCFSLRIKPFNLQIWRFSSRSERFSFSDQYICRFAGDSIFSLLYISGMQEVYYLTLSDILHAVNWIVEPMVNHWVTEMSPNLVHDTYSFHNLCHIDIYTTYNSSSMNIRFMMKRSLAMHTCSITNDQTCAT